MTLSGMIMVLEWGGGGRGRYYFTTAFGGTGWVLEYLLVTLFGDVVQGARKGGEGAHYLVLLA